MNLQFSPPFPDELAVTHLYRNWALNDTIGSAVHTRSAFFAKATRNQRPSHCSHPWTALYLPQIMAYLSGMTPQAYRANHTTLALTGNWRHMYSEKPIKHSKVNVYEVDQFCRQSPASAFPFKLCLQCRDDDLRSHVMTYWHREHHIAGIDICPKHGIALQRIEWRDVYTASNPATLSGEVSHNALIQANSHPILTRYREIALAALGAPAQVQYTRAHDQLLERATDMGLCRRELHHTGTHSYLKHAIPQYLYTHLPRVWMEEHFNSAFLDMTFIPSDTSKDEYHAELNHLDHSDSSKPIFLFLALATLFESSDQICTILFDRTVRTLPPPNCADEGLELLLPS